jgi:hypothetical protein
VNYTVEWVPTAEGRLTTNWLNAPDRGAVTAAANAIDARLQRDPYAQSESRTGATRVTFEAPLGVRFEVNDADRHVPVLDVWRFR